MSFDSWSMYFIAILLIAVAPGSMAVLSMHHGIHYGKKYSLATALGSVVAALLLMLASAAGLGALLSASEYGFTLLKWCGAGYLLFLGVKMLMTPAYKTTLNIGPASTVESIESNPVSVPIKLFKQAFLVGISNPKDLIFFAALFPQFIDLSLPQVPQLLILAATWAIVDFSFVMIYACMASTIAPRLKSSNKHHWFDRTSGGIFISLATLLVLKAD